ncbi:alpha-amylase family glycosyl hydrolase [Sulfitobacter sp. LCG007]
MSINEDAKPGMGAIPHDGGVAFRVWAPNASSLSVVGDFNDWAEDRHPMTSEQGGYWYTDVPEAKPGQEYRFLIEGPDGALSRIDPYARAVTNSVGNGVITDLGQAPDDGFTPPPWNEMVIYELHIGTFGGQDADGVGTFDSAVGRLDHLKSLGVNAVQIMPTAEFAGDMSWGYNPAHIFAVETAYGGPEGFRAFVRAAHEAGMAVILDVVYNHFGPSDLDLWRFDGWGEGEAGGIYFYNDWRAETPWGATRPDYGRPEVRQFIRDNALFWLEAYGVDGLRWDMTLYIRNVSEDEGDDAQYLEDGWSLMQWVNDEIAERFPGRITIAEDLRTKDAVTAGTADNGAGFGAQWDADFVHPVREVLTTPLDEDRSMQALAGALTKTYNGDPLQRVVYTESHDEVANGKARVPHEIDSDDQTAWHAQKRSTLGAAMVFFSPGIPMIFQGQEFLQGDWFDDSVPLDWSQREDFRGIIRLYRDLVKLRLELRALSGRGVEILLADEERKLFVFRRFDADDQPGAVIAMNFQAEEARDIAISVPEGQWTLRLNTDWQGYSKDFGDFHTTDMHVEEVDGARTGSFSVGPYSAVLFTS